MDIPAVFARFADGGVALHEGHFRRTVPVVDGAPHPLSSISGMVDRESRSPFLVVDVNSLAGRFFCEKIMKNVKVRGASMWLMTFIEDADDLFDAFNYTADMVVSPYHVSESDAALADIYDVSDSFVPAVYVNRGKAVLRKGRPGDLRRTLDRLNDIGFGRICILDSDMSVPEDEWVAIADRYPSAIPFPGWAGGTCPEGFETRVAPVRFRRPSAGILRRLRARLRPLFCRFPGTPDARATSSRPLWTAP